MTPVAIIGGGISGLSAAYYLAKAGVAATLIERQPRLGGVIETLEIQGNIVEGGPDSFLAAKPAALELIRELGLGDEVIGSNDHQRVTYVVKNGRLVPLPDGLMMMVPTQILPMATSPLLSWGTKIRMGLEFFRKPDGPKPERSVAEFIEEHYGRETVEYLAEPLLSGVYGGDPRELSMSSVLTRFVELETQYGSLTRGVLAERKRAKAQGSGGTLFRTLKGGLGTLTRTLESRIPATRITGAAEAIEQTPQGWRIRLQGDWLEAAHVVVACPAWQAAQLLPGPVGDLLQDVGYSSSMTVALGYDRATFRHPLNGFGFLVPARERRLLVACTWVGRKFNHREAEDTVLLRAFCGGAGNDAVLQKPDGEVVAGVREDLRRIMGIDEVPKFTAVSRWPRSMAQYTVGHATRMEALREHVQRLPGLHLIGNAYTGIGIPDCIRMGKAAAETVAGL